jgi:excinuclease UvrABC nuclease subunit
MNLKDFKKNKLPNTPGVYFFLGPLRQDLGGKDILYIGKATSLRDRVKSYFGKDLINTRGPGILDMVTGATDIKWQETDSVLEALILEANLIKKHQPKYNTKEKDNKSFNYICITKEEIPKVLVIRGRNLAVRGEASHRYQSVFGPFPNGTQLKDAMKIIRRIFPYIDDQSSKKNNKEFYKQLGLSPENSPLEEYPKGEVENLNASTPSLRATPQDGNKQYKNNIKNLKLFFEGKKKSVVINLKKEMAAFSKSKDFENAAKVRDKIFALNHINDVALIKEDIFTSQNNSNSSRFTPEGPYTDKNSNNFVSQIKMQNFRIEAYDIAHLSGQNMVGVMTVMENGELAKGEYKKFIIRTQDKSNDIGALEEVLSRRLRHTEWGLPSLIVMDGSTAQINIAKSVLNRYQFKIPVVSVVKDDRHKAKAIMGDEDIIKKYKKEILLINNESHRFAIAFHKKRRDKNFLNN